MSDAASIEVYVRLFAMLRDIAGTDRKRISLRAPARASAVLEELAKEFPRMLELKNHVRVAVNTEYVEGDHQLKDNDEVALIPPVSGG